MIILISINLKSMVYKKTYIKFREIRQCKTCCKGFLMLLLAKQKNINLIK